MQCYNVCAQVSDLSAFTFLFCVRFIPPRLVEYVQPGATAEPGGHQANCGRSYSIYTSFKPNLCVKAVDSEKTKIVIVNLRL